MLPVSRMRQFLFHYDCSCTAWQSFCSEVLWCLPQSSLSLLVSVVMVILWEASGLNPTIWSTVIYSRSVVVVNLMIWWLLVLVLLFKLNGYVEHRAHVTEHCRCWLYCLLHCLQQAVMSALQTWNSFLVDFVFGLIQIFYEHCGQFGLLIVSGTWTGWKLNRC